MTQPINIYIDCTQTYTAEVLTGIQRVVRQVLDNAAHLQSKYNVRICPVIYDGSGFKAIDALPVHHYQHNNAPLKSSASLKSWIAQGLIKSVTRFIRSMLFMNAKSFLKKNFPSVFYMLQRIYLRTKYLLTRNNSLSTVNVNFNHKDILFMLDAAWFPHLKQGYMQAKQQGAMLVFAAYDIIPVEYPQFCDALFTQSFSQYAQDSAAVADGYIAISQTVQQEMQSYLNKLVPTLVTKTQFDYFYLGADFSDQAPSGHIRIALKSVFGIGENSYLMVSTIEPRKNHTYLLDVFDRLWGQGLDVNLVIVGRIGWQVDILMGRMMTHPQLNKRLFLFHDLTDAELSYCYANAKALVFSSIVEGFGLPIIEALQHKLPVIVSDIPIHREVGGDLAIYMDLNNVDDLVDKIKVIESTGIDPSHQVPENYHWLSWEEATEILLQKLLKMQQSVLSKL